MNFLVAMPRETDTSLFTSRVSQGLFLIVCLTGLVLNILVFFPNCKMKLATSGKKFSH